MADRMTEKNRFTLWEYPQMLQHFEYMAQNGWTLAECNEVQFVYEKSEPKTVHFAATFFPDYDYLDPNPPQNLQRLWEFCAENGWQHITDSASMQIFYSERENPTPIHTDAVVQLDNFHAMMKAEKLKGWWREAVMNGIFIAVLAVVFAVFMQDRSIADVMQKISAVSLVLSAYYVYQFVRSVCSLAAYYSWYRKAVKTAQQDDVFLTFSPNKIWSDADWVITTFFLSAFAILLFKSGNPGITLFWAIPGIALFIIVYKLTKYMRDNGVSPKENRRITGIIAAVVVVLFIMALPYIIIILADLGLLENMVTVTRTYPQ